MRTTFNIQVPGYASNLMPRLGPFLTPVAGAPSGCTGTSARVTGSIRATGLRSLQIGGTHLDLPLYRLPSAPLNAVLQESEASIPDVSRLEALLAGPCGWQWWSAVQDIASQPSRAGGVPTGLLQQTAQWQSGETYVTVNRDWITVTLAFDVHTTHTDSTHDTVIGVDVGQTPLAVALGGQFRHALPGLPPLPAMPLGVPEAAMRLAQVAVYGAARQQWESLFALMLPRASLIAVERLDFRGLQARFQQQCHDHGINDATLAWLPQLAREAGVQIARVEPAGTSLFCPTCVRPGDRQGAVLHCATHGALDAHDVAAYWIGHLGAAQQLNKWQVKWAGKRSP